MKFLTGRKINAGFKSDRLIVRYEEDRLLVDAVRKGKISVWENFSVREIPDEVLIRRLQACAARPPASVVLVLPRKMLIERRFELPGSDAEMNQDLLMNRVRQSLPVGLDELAFGITVKKQKSGVCGTLLAVPLKNIDALLTLLDSAGLSPDEIISSDQALMGLIAGEKGSVLLMHEGLETVDLILAENGLIKAVKTLEKHGNEIRQEIDFFLLESGCRPEKLFFAGDSDSGMVKLPGQKLRLPQGLPAALYGASCLDLSRVISLLPEDRKVRKQAQMQKKLRRGLVGWILLAIALLTAGVAAHRLRPVTWAEQWRLEYEELKPTLLEIQTGLGVQDELRRRQMGNREALECLRVLSLHIPAGVVLEELVWSSGEIRLRGASVTYAGVSAAVQAAEEAVHSAAYLDYARVRKKESREFFEFSLTARRDKESPGPDNPELCSILRQVRAEDWRAQGLRLAAARQTVDNKKRLLADYTDFQKKRFSVPGEIIFLNEWVSALMAFSERHGLKISKLEPLGKSSSDRYPACAIRLSCGGGLKDMIAFLYSVASSGDGVAVDEIRLFPKREVKNWMTCEMLLSKF